MSDGSVAVVMGPGEGARGFDRPSVRILVEGMRLRQDDVADLSRIPEGDLAIHEVLDPRKLGIDLLTALFEDQMDAD